MTRPLARILLADPYDIVRRGVRLLVEEQSCYHIVAEASDGREALGLTIESNPTVAIVDCALPKLNGVELTRQVRRASPRTQVLIYTDIEHENVIRDALLAGAKGFVLKSDPEHLLVAALKSISFGRPYFSGKISEVLLEQFLQSSPESKESCLTHREREVIQLVAEGRLNKQIAHLLDVSVKTIESHRANVMHKLNLRTTADLVRYAIRNSIVQL